MAKVKYYYDTKTLSYKRIELSGLNKVKRLFYFLIGSSVTGLIMIILFFQFFDSPKEKRLNREIDVLTSQYESVDSKLKQVELVLDDIQHRDDNIYRVIFEADPIPKSIRKAGYGGINRYQDLKGYSNS
ncbi:MAG: M23 family peptidase, partial [Flavobacteriales bacterium]|nr:M23 family peptidase [Flavobacteriales bacterium]